MNTPLADLHEGPAKLRALRRFLLIVLLLGMLGTEAELVLTSHTEDLAQWIPVLLILAALIVIAWHAADRRRTSLRVFQCTMVLFIISGIAGIILHYNGKVEFQLEMNPSLSGMTLFWQAIQTISPPALAPGVMIQFGLLGLACTYGHPLLKASNDASKTEGA